MPEGPCDWCGGDHDVDDCPQQWENEDPDEEESNEGQRVR